ncbi:MAG: major outer membrane protein [Arcobacter sp.]|nr:major outer membrane protein [Arcobacter sp.]
MKKFAKMSLVAAVAVAGMTSVNAADLTEAIKGVDVSGMARYRYTENDVKDGRSDVTNGYDVEVNVKAPVNDTVTAVFKVDVSAGYRADANIANVAKDGKPSVNLEDVYFSFALPAATVNVGKQNVPGTLFDSDNGTGVVVTAPAGPVSFTGSYFNATENYEDTYGLGVAGSFGAVNASLWYADITDVKSAFAVALDGTVGPVSLGFGYADADDATAGSGANDFNSLKVTAAATIGQVSLSAAYGKSGENGTAELHGGNDAGVNGVGLSQVKMNTADTSIITLGASIAATDKLSLGLGYLMGTTKVANVADTDLSEIKVSASYAMSSNFNISSYYSIAEKDAAGNNDTESNQGRLELKYSF